MHFLPRPVCYKMMQHIMSAIRNFFKHRCQYFCEKVILYLFLVTVIDSWGKPAPAILQLSLNWVGDFDECQGVQSASNNPNVTLPKHLKFQGKYCTAASSPPQQKGIANPMAMGGTVSHLIYIINR